VSNLVLNQYRKGSGYKDVVAGYTTSLLGISTLSPSFRRLLSTTSLAKVATIYFGAGKVLSVYEDTEDVVTPTRKSATMSSSTCRSISIPSQAAVPGKTQKRCATASEG